MTAGELIEVLEEVGEDAEVCIVMAGRMRTVSWVDSAGTATMPDGEFEDSLKGGQYVYIVEGSQRYDNPYLTEEEREAIDWLLG